MARTRAGATLIEVIIAAVISAIGFAGAWTGLGQCLRIADSHMETIAATESLVQRTEQARAAGWGVITSAAGISNKILNTALSNASTLPGLQEQMTVTPYPQTSPATTPVTVVRNADGSEQITSQPPAGLNLRAILAVRIDLQLTWQSHMGGRQRVRQMSTVVALGALLN